MKNNRKNSKIISLILVTYLLTCAVVPAQAQTTAHTATAFSAELNENDMFIPEEVAYYLAEYFIQDMLPSGQTIWNDETVILATEPLFDESGESLTAYTFELTSGYITVSAYADMPNLILEWADETEPLYTELDLEPQAKVVYTGPASYLADTGATTLQTIDGTQIARTKVKNEFSALRDMENVPKQALAALANEKKLALSQNRISANGVPDNYPGGYITDPIAYAYHLHGGSWACSDWANYWEDYMPFFTVNTFPEQYDCGPVAIVNALIAYGQKHGRPDLQYDDFLSVFDKVLEVNDASGGEYYTEDIPEGEISGGTFFDTAGQYIKECFSAYGVSVQAYSGTCTVNSIKQATKSDALAYIHLEDNSVYGNHAVLGYAWTCMKQNPSGKTIHFVKACDGGLWGAGRYLDMSTIANQKLWRITNL